MDVPLRELEDLQHALELRALSLVLHASGYGGWIAWVYAPDDPALLCTGEAETVPEAVAVALGKWDGREQSGAHRTPASSERPS